jgi:opacity protein-like surface antigen
MTLRKFIRTGAAALGALAVASVSQANAADLYAGMKEAPVYVPAPLWTGFYAGGHLGAAWENFSFNRRSFDDDCWGLMNYADTVGGTAYDHCGYDSNHHRNPADLIVNRHSDADAFGGIQFGYNFQSPGAFVYGIEVDLGGMSLNGNGRASGATSWRGDALAGAAVGARDWSTPVAFEGKAEGGFYGDVTGRLGYAWGPAMLYAKGGFAFLNATLNLKESIYDSWGLMGCGTAWCDFSQNRSTTLTGWTVGGGLEWKVSPMWSIKVEYLHFDFGNFNNNCCNDWFNQNHPAWNVVNNWDNRANLTVDTVKLGFNYFWNAPPAPLK